MIARRAGLIAALFIAAYFAVLWQTAPAMGFTRDEGYYFKAAEEYARWWDVVFSRRFLQAFEDDEIKRHFSYNTEHPALVKLALGGFHSLLHEHLKVATPSQAYRACGFFFAALSLLGTFLLGRLIVSAEVGLLAMLLLACIPRYFYDAHLACFDVPITAMWVLSLWAFFRARVSSPGEPGRRKKIILAGVIFGLALATKLNALFLPPIFVIVALWMVEPGAVRLARGPSGGRDLVLPTVPWELITCAILGPIVFYLHWPYLWHAPFERTGAYIAFHLHHEHYPISYYHDVLIKPPFPLSFVFVMSMYTIPGPLLVLGAIGTVVALGRALLARVRPEKLVIAGGDMLLAVATLLPILLIAMPGTPIFGGVKHWYNAMPTLAILAARCGLWAAQAVAARAGEVRPMRQTVAALVIAVFMLAPGALGIVNSHPNGIGYYNELAGGYRGGARLGFQRLFWGGLARPLFDQLPRPGHVFFNRTNYDNYNYYQREGTIPKDVYYSNSAKGSIDAAISFEQPEHGETQGDMWSSLGTRPIAGTYQHNVVLNQLYVKGQSKSPPPAK